MRGRRLVGLSVAVAIAAGCGNSATPSPSAADASAGASPPIVAQASAPSPSPSPSPSPTPTPSATATPVPTPTPSATPVPTPVPWKSFTSKRFHYKITYPPTWVVTPGDAKFADQYDAYGFPYVYVSRDTVSGTVSLAQTISRETTSIKTHYHAKLTSTVGVKLASGYSGKILTFNGIDDGLKVLIQVAIVAKGDTGYFLSLFADQTTAAADRVTFRKMILSWRPT
jgi:hypothetical protein